MSIELPCIVERVTYRKDNFCILSCNLDQYSKRYNQDMVAMMKGAISEKYKTFTVIITNLMTQIEETIGGQYIFVGDLVNDPKRGLQFKAEFYYMDKPSTEDGMRIFLMTLPNIKEVRSKQIIEKFGGVQGVIDILNNRPEELLRAGVGINERRLAVIKKEWDERHYLCEFYRWLVDHNVSVSIADKIFKAYGVRSAQVLEENPYVLCDIRGIGFVRADRIAHDILKEIPLNARIKACISYVLDEQTNSESNLCIPYSTLKTCVLSSISDCDKNLNKRTDSDAILAAIKEVLDNDSKKARSENKLEKPDFELVKDLEENVIYIYKYYVWAKEVYIGLSLLQRSLNKPVLSDNVKRTIDSILENGI